MEYSHRYHAYPTQEVAERLEYDLNIHRQLYNHVRWDYENSPEDDKPSEYDQNNKLPEWKRKWPVFSELHEGRPSHRRSVPPQPVEFAQEEREGIQRRSAQMTITQ